MLVRKLGAPILALVSTYGHALSSSVVFSFSGEVLVITYITKWLAAFPALVRISGVAPDCIFAIRVSAVAMLS